MLICNGIRKTKDEDLIELYEQEIKDIKRKITEKEAILNKTVYSEQDFGTATDKVFNVLKNPISMWQSNNHNDKRTILLMYFEGRLHYDYEKGFGTADLGYSVKLMADTGPTINGSVEMSAVSGVRNS